MLGAARELAKRLVTMPVRVKVGRLPGAEGFPNPHRLSVLSHHRTIEQAYRDLPQSGIDLIETDIPVEVGRLLYRESTIPASKLQFFLTGRAEH